MDLLASLPAKITIALTDEQRDWWLVISTLLSVLAICFVISMIVQHRAYAKRLDRIETKLGLSHEVPPAT